MPTLIQNASTGRRFATWARSPGFHPRSAHAVGPRTVAL